MVCFQWIRVIMDKSKKIKVVTPKCDGFDALKQAPCQWILGLKSLLRPLRFYMLTDTVYLFSDKAEWLAFNESLSEESKDHYLLLSSADRAYIGVLPLTDEHKTLLKEFLTLPYSRCEWYLRTKSVKGEIKLNHKAPRAWHKQRLINGSRLISLLAVLTFTGLIFKRYFSP